MLRFLARRLLTAIPVILGVVILVFVLARVIPGDPCKAALGERATKQACDAYTAREGLDDPLPVQLGRYINDLLHGDLGESSSQRRPVSDILIERLPTTIELSIAALTWPSSSACPSACWPPAGGTRPPTWSAWWVPTSASRCRCSGSP